MSTDSLVRKISSRLYYLACYHFFFSVLDTEGTQKRSWPFVKLVLTLLGFCRSPTRGPLAVSSLSGMSA